VATRIGIIGAGGIGSIVGGMLTKAGHDVTLMEQWPEHVEAMKKVGLRLSGTCGEHVVPVKALHIHEIQSLREPFDYVFISVKSYDTEWATAMAVAGKERTLGCVITISAGMYDAGHAIARIMNDVAATKATTNLWGERWSKLAVNCMVNPISGLSGFDSAEARTDHVPRRIAVFTAAEVIQVGRARGYEADMARDAKSRVGGRPLRRRQGHRRAEGQQGPLDGDPNAHPLRETQRVDSITPV
jgi:2-dehydropantoate 2-reductase